MIAMLNLKRHVDTGNSALDTRTVDGLTAKVNAHYTRADGTIDYERKDRESNIVSIIEQQGQKPLIFAELNCLMSTGSNILE
jgi:hypothetical protein